MAIYLQKNDIIAGRITKVTDKGAFVDVGYNTLGFIPKNEYLGSIADQNHKIEEFLIIWINSYYPELILSKKKLQYSLNWTKLLKVYNENFFLFTRLLFWNKGGVLCGLEGVRAFLPKSHLPKFYKRNKVQKFYLPLKIFNYNYQSKNVILSCRSTFFKLHSKDSTLLKYGFITSIKSFGIFINIYGSRSLIHYSNLVFKNVAKNYKIGQRIKVKLIKVNSVKYHYKLCEVF
uniref:Ribosomal protein S1 n=1 Tax=Olisthodiscus luteus TaxID=83000 RepID=A0A7U0KSK4_OLILU|nr:ribosomal protein S1 [Olisthodiscus luteus]YP_010152842.1 ribosomal protein S1 [Olisthodiscus luteus]QQW50449.1 ribosomal protein S1 [Olisthodiscus luteus]QQW50503.1 ribosomal protein S1 [Olisthodiscus luteus]